MSSNDGEPIKSDELTSKLKTILEKRSEVIEVTEDEIGGFRIRIKDCSQPVFISIQTQVNKMSEIGFYELYVTLGGNNVTNFSKFGSYSGKSIEKAVESFFNSDFIKKP